MSAIEWKREQRRILLPVLVLAPFPVTHLTAIEGRALIDTGSSVSGVSRHLAEKLQLTGLGKRPLTSAQGEDRLSATRSASACRPTRRCPARRLSPSCSTK
jgi:hypothetical protein